MQKQKKTQKIRLAAALLLLVLTACSLSKPADKPKEPAQSAAEKQTETNADQTANQDNPGDKTGREASSKETAQTKDNTDALTKDESDQETADHGSDQPLAKPLTAEQAKVKLLKDYAAYRQRLAEYVPEENLLPVISAENLYAVEEEDRERIRQCDDLTGSGFNQMRERYPGKYQWYLMFKTKEAWAKYESAAVGNEDYMRLTCFYVNLNTGKTFIDDQILGIFALSDLENAAYTPYVLDGFADQEFLLWVLEKKGIIDRAYDYGDAWSITNEIEWENSVGEAITRLGGEWDDSVDYTYQEDDILRLPVYHRETYQRVGIYDLDVRHRTVTDYYTGQELYRDPLANYRPKKLTEKSAVKELFQILKKLYIIDDGEIKDWRSEVKEFKRGGDWMPEGYEITLWPPRSEEGAVYRINRQGTKVSRYNSEREEYDLEYEPIYGTAMWSEQN